MRPASLPALATLRAFAAAARHESLTLAAAELGVTPSAVSHQVRTLEEELGTPLFLRAPRQLRLTPEGQRLAAGLQQGFAAIAAAVEAARAAQRDATLRISALPLFTSAWLIPRLERFEARARRLGLQLRLEIESGHAVADLQRGEADIAIRNLPRREAALATRRLIDLRAVPLCAPGMAAALRGPADLAAATVIQITARPAAWANWLAATGAAGVVPRAVLAVDTVPTALEAAAAGRGVALGLDPLVWDTPAAARLVMPFAVPPVPAGSYVVAHRRADRGRPAVRAFADWIAAEMRTDLPRLMALSRAAVSASAGRPA